MDMEIGHTYLIVLNFFANYAFAFNNKDLHSNKCYFGIPNLVSFYVIIKMSLEWFIAEDKKLSMNMWHFYQNKNFINVLETDLRFRIKLSLNNERAK